MLLVTDQGHYFTVVADHDDPTWLWARSQDLESIQHAADWLAQRAEEAYPIRDEPDWDYQFRIAVSRPDWAAYLEHATMELSATRLKPAVAAARGARHPVSRVVEEVFYFMSHNRPDGSRPAWLGPRRRRTRSGAAI